MCLNTLVIWIQISSLLLLQDHLSDDCIRAVKKHELLSENTLFWQTDESSELWIFYLFAAVLDSSSLTEMKGWPFVRQNTFIEGMLLLFSLFWKNSLVFMIGFSSQISAFCILAWLLNVFFFWEGGGNKKQRQEKSNYGAGKKLIGLIGFFTIALGLGWALW